MCRRITGTKLTGESIYELSTYFLIGSFQPGRSHHFRARGLATAIPTLNLARSLWSERFRTNTKLVYVP